ncbi:MAG: DODA-type extradiol aromatic ring-opening family dioxygenase, partial [Tumebacillaceae bacterium]
MNPFVFACITPHGSEIVEALSQQNPALMEKTRHSMQLLGARMEAANPDVIIVLTPHGVRIDGQFAIADCERMYGEVEDNGGIVKMERAVDRQLARSIFNEAKDANIPAGAVNFATASGPYSCLPLDWGVIVPLHFMPDVPIVVITPSRFVEFADHIKLGQAISRV